MSYETWCKISRQAVGKFLQILFYLELVELFEAISITNIYLDKLYAKADGELIMHEYIKICEFRHIFWKLGL